MVAKVVILNETDINENVSLERLRINPSADIKAPPVYCQISGSPIMTAGNFSLINGKAKSGKTFLLGAIVASLVSNIPMLGIVQGSLPKDKNKVLYFDTEQSEYHATRTIKRICEMAGNTIPDNLISYGLRPLTSAERVSAIEGKIKSTDNLGAVVVDGIRDLLTKGINDEEEATSLINKLLKWTSDYKIHMILLLHQNKTDLNARGHIGTEILNKAETTITITKKDKANIFVVSCDYSRDLAFEDFALIIQDNLPVRAEMPPVGQTKGKEPKKIRDEEHIEKLKLIFKETRKIGIKDLNEAIRYHFSVGENKARDFISHYELRKWLNREREAKFVYYQYRRELIGTEDYST